MSKIAHKNICNGLVLWIDEILYDVDDRIKIHYNGDKMHTVKIYYTKKGRAYFKIKGERHYIDEFMRV